MKRLFLAVIAFVATLATERMFTRANPAVAVRAPESPPEGREEESFIIIGGTAREGAEVGTPEGTGVVRVVPQGPKAMVGAGFRQPRHPFVEDYGDPAEFGLVSVL